MNSEGLRGADRGLDDGIQGEAADLNFLEAELEAEFQRVGPDKVAAFVAEPVVGAALGCVPAIPGYFNAAQTQAVVSRAISKMCSGYETCTL